MTETKAKYKVKIQRYSKRIATTKELTDDLSMVKKHGGQRTARPGKRIGKPAEIGTGGKTYADYLDDETIELLKAIHPIRSQAIRMAAKQYKF